MAVDVAAVVREQRHGGRPVVSVDTGGTVLDVCGDVGGTASPEPHFDESGSAFNGIPVMIRSWSKHKPFLRARHYAYHPPPALLNAGP